MLNNNENGYLNVTIRNDDADNDTLVSLVGIFKKLKKYFLPWLVLSVVTIALTFGYATVSKSSKKLPITALVGFTFKGIEEGLAPDGNAFYVNTMKNPAVIEAALTELGYPLDDLEMIRQNISIKGILPTDAIDRITTYKSIYENGSSSSMAAAKEMLDVKYYPTQFKVTFKYADTSFNAEQAVEIFNTVLESYRKYFFDSYGYNQALGSATLALDYKDYDYAEAVDVFDVTLSTLQTYVNRLSADDTTRFRSSATGYTFSDLLEAIKAVRSMDLEMLSSYVTSNNVTKDKNTLITYYQYRVESLTRSKAIYEEKLASLTESIAAYTKDTVIFMGGDNTQTQYTTSSEQYDALVEQKITTQTDLSTSIQQINFYNTRIEALNAGSAASGEKIKRTENDLIALNEKVNKIIDDVNKTADEYYENVSLANAYNILVPASTDNATVVSVIKDVSMTLLILEAIIALLYFCIAFISAIIAENKKQSAVASEHVAFIANADASHDEDDEISSEDKSTKDEKVNNSGNNNNNNSNNSNNRKKR